MGAKLTNGESAGTAACQPGLADSDQSVSSNTAGVHSRHAASMKEGQLHGLSRQDRKVEHVGRFAPPHQQVDRVQSKINVTSFRATRRYDDASPVVVAVPLRVSGSCIPCLTRRSLPQLESVIIQQRRRTAPLSEAPINRMCSATFRASSACCGQERSVYRGQGRHLYTLSDAR